MEKIKIYLGLFFILISLGLHLVFITLYNNIDPLNPYNQPMGIMEILFPFVVLPFQVLGCIFILIEKPVIGAAITFLGLVMIAIGIFFHFLVYAAIFFPLVIPYLPTVNTIVLAATIIQIIGVFIILIDVHKQIKKKK